METVITVVAYAVFIIFFLSIMIQFDPLVAQGVVDLVNFVSSVFKYIRGKFRGKNSSEKEGS